MFEKVDEDLYNSNWKRFNIIPIIDQLVDGKFEKELILIFGQV